MSGYMIPVGGRHLGDETLLQLLDGAHASSDARAHLSGCGDCSSRFAALEKASALLRASLPDVPMPRIDLRAVRRRRPWIISLPVAAAASFVLLASAAAATPPIRRWILRQVSGDAPAAVESPPRVATPTARSAGVVASFAPADTLFIRVDRRQADGAILLDVAPGDRVSAQTIGGTTEEMIVLPGQLRIANGAASTGDYRITVPPSVRVVHVLIGGDEAAVIRNETGLHRRIELRTTSGR